MINPTILYNSFSPAFITQYQVAFTELLRLGQVASEKALEGLESKKEDQTAKHLLLILEALDSPELDEKEIEALEYCLRNLNESLVTPTIDGIVSVQPRPHVPVSFDNHVYWPGVFSISGQNVDLKHIIPFYLAAEPTIFNFFGVGIDMTYHKSALSIPIDQGSFILSGQNTSFLLTHNNQYFTELDLAEAIPGIQVWEAEFDWGVGSDTLVASGPIGSDSGTIVSEETTVTVTVTKSTNGGFSQDVWQIQFSKNGSAVSTRTGSAGEAVNESYIYTGLSHSDILEVDIIEG